MVDVGGIDVVAAGVDVGAEVIPTEGTFRCTLCRRGSRRGNVAVGIISSSSLVTNSLFIIFFLDFWVC